MEIGSKKEKVEWLSQMIKQCNESYRQGVATIYDFDYDTMVEELRELDPENDWFKNGVQDSQPKTRKLAIPTPMYSLNKCKSLDEIGEWLKSKIGEGWESEYLVITPKLDGLSILRDLTTGYSYTRGDGLVGQDCSDHLDIIDGKAIDKGDDSIMRGEIVFRNYKWTQFKEKFPGYKSNRNSAVGLINGDFDSKKYHQYKYLSYIAYDIVNKDWNKALKLEKLNKTNECQIPFLTSSFQSLDEKQLEQLFFTFAEYFPIDGLVIDINDAKYRNGDESNNNPTYARAYKHPSFSQKKKTKILSIEKNINRYGVITPVCVIDPIELAGAEISRVNGINMSYIYDWVLMPGQEITVVRSGEVIPKIVAVQGVDIPFKEEFKKDKEYKLNYNRQVNKLQLSLVEDDFCDLRSFMDNNNECPFCKSHLVWDKTFTNLVCQNQDCEEVKIQKLCDFFKICGVDDFKETTFRQLYKEGWENPEQILSLTNDQLMELEGWAQRSSQMFIDEMKKLKVVGIPYAKFLHATGYFENIGEKTIQLIVDKFPHSINLEEMLKIKGVGEIIIKKYIEGIKRCGREYSKSQIKISYIESPLPKQGLLSGSQIVFTGFRDGELKELLESKGAIVTDNFTKSTNLLIVKDKTQTSTKMQKATKQGTSIYTIEEIKEKLKSL